MDEAKLPMIAEGVTAAYKAGMESERRLFTEMLTRIFTAYDFAQRDPIAAIPSPLMAAIEAARSNFAPRLPRSVPDVPGLPEHDQDVYGRPLKAGT